MMSGNSPFRIHYIAAIPTVVCMGYIIYRFGENILRPLLTSHNRTPYSGKVQYGRRTAKPAKDMVVFIIGMRINKIHRIDIWWWVLHSMIKMLRELQADTTGEAGFLGNEFYGAVALFFGYPSIQITYWESMEKLMNFAHGKTHIKGMAEFMRRVSKTNGEVGVFHESYEIAKSESIYLHMNDFGLARAVGTVPAKGKLQSAKGRLASFPLPKTIMAESQLSEPAGEPEPSHRECPFSS